jgi:hypothetical protein
MSKILGKNVSDVIETDLYWYGIDFVKEVYKQMCIVNTVEKYITIKTDRRECEIYVDNKGPKYICSLSFFNNLGIELLKLEFSECMAVSVIDAIYSYEDFNMKDISIPIDSVTIPGISYILKLDRDMTNNCMSHMTIFQHNILYPNSYIPVVSCSLTSDNILSDFLYAMYFSWIIDLDNCNDISLEEGLYSAMINQS